MTQLLLKILEVEDFLGVHRQSIEFAPLTIVCGPNRAGKSSLQNAIRLALCGEISRVHLKSQYRQLVRDPAKLAKVVATLSDGNSRSVVLKYSGTGHSIPQDAVIAPELLDMHRLSGMLVPERAEALYALCGVQKNREAILEKLTAAQVSFEKAERVLPLLEASWQAGEQACQDALKEARWRWRSATGEVYGIDKAEGWTAPNTADADTIEKAEALDKNKERLAIAERSRDEFLPEVLKLRTMVVTSGAIHTCPACGEKSPLFSEDTIGEAKAALPARENSLTVLQNAVASRQRDVQDSIAAKAAVAEAHRSMKWKQSAADAAHQDVKEWSALATMLGPGGIRMQLLSRAIQTINKMLQLSGDALGRGTVQIGSAAEITLDERPYALLSESEQWLADTMLTAAIVEYTAAGLMLLDRFDVLDVPSRRPVIDWLFKRPFQVVVFATLKKPPAFPEELAWKVKVVWMQPPLTFEQKAKADAEAADAEAAPA